VDWNGPVTTGNLLLVVMIIRYILSFLGILQAQKKFFILYFLFSFFICSLYDQLLVWNQHSQQPTLRLTEHTAAVKAIAWSPHQSGLLVSGGGTADRCIRFWNTTNGHQLNSVDTGSQVYFFPIFFHWDIWSILKQENISTSLMHDMQVCNLVWSKNVNELVSTHGYSQNQIMVWKYPSLAKVLCFDNSTYYRETTIIKLYA